MRPGSPLPHQNRFCRVRKMRNVATHSAHHGVGDVHSKVGYSMHEDGVFMAEAGKYEEGSNIGSDGIWEVK